MATLAPPASSTGARKPTKLQRRPSPSAADARPKRAPHSFPVWKLINVPKRILVPPKATGMVGSVRSFKATPLADVKLADVIANKHLAPLSLKDFEGYLVYREHSAESLYFILCESRGELRCMRPVARPSSLYLERRARVARRAR